MNTRSSIMTKRTTWINEMYPSVKGWTRSVHTRGPSDKLAGKLYYNYYPPSGTQLRSIKQVNARMESDDVAKKTCAVKKENAYVIPDDTGDVIIVLPPPKPNPVIVDLTSADEEQECETVPASLHVYGNVAIHLTHGGGYHIKWNE